MCFYLGLTGRNLFAVRSADYYGTFQVKSYYPDYFAGQLPVADIRYDKLTDIIYFSIYPNSDGSLNLSQINLTRQQQLVQTAHQNKVRVSICIGGWGLSANFSPVAASPATRAVLVGNLVQYCLTHNLDGIDLDWEPVSVASDKLNYTSLIQEIKTAMEPHSLILSVAVAAQGSEFYTSAISSVDSLHVMAYDLGTPHSLYEDALAALAHWETFGFPRSKIILGLPFYGRDSSWNFYPYKDIVNLYHPGPDMDEVNGIYFNGISAISAKTRYTFENHYAGVMSWDLTLDTADNSSLLTSISDTIHLLRKPDLNFDGRVDLFDMGGLSSYWHRTDCDDGTVWCDGSDLDHSGSIDFSDFIILTGFWLSL